MMHLPKLFFECPVGVVLTTSVLKSMGITPQLAHHYSKQGWLIPVGDGAYLRKNDTPSWAGALATVQSADIQVYVGAGQALDLIGLNQNVMLGKPFVHLFTPHTIRLPKWFLDYDFGANFHVTRTRKYTENHLMEHKTTGFNLTISRPEQAILEVCRFVPKIYGFETLRNYVESLISLNPLMMQEILEANEFIKEKRIFLYMASHINHTWYKKLNLEKIDLGKGPRQVVADGVYNSEFNIFVPKSF